MDVKRAYRFRFYPTDEQARLLSRTFGCVRYVQNYMLRIRTDAWLNDRKRVGYHETSSLLTKLKKDPDHLWLNEVASVPVQQGLRHLQSAFSNFFARRAKYPKFRSKNDRQSAEYTSSAFKWDGKELRLARMDGPLAIRWSRSIPKGAKVTTVTVSKDAAGRHFVSMLCDDAVSPLRKSRQSVGVDMGLTDFVVTSGGSKFQSPKPLAVALDRLALLQRRTDRKRRGSKNRAKARLKVARLHARIRDIRRDFLHKLSTKLIRENQAICVESLAVRNMIRNRSLARSISDASWGEFLAMLRYKAEWFGRDMVELDRWFPSTKRCSVCGHTLASLPLSQRTWTCSECKTVHDRDINAARNLLAAGQAVSACGG